MYYASTKTSFTLLTVIQTFSPPIYLKGHFNCPHPKKFLFYLLKKILICFVLVMCPHILLCLKQFYCLIVKGHFFLFSVKIWLKFNGFKKENITPIRCISYKLQGRYWLVAINVICNTHWEEYTLYIPCYQPKFICIKWLIGITYTGFCWFCFMRGQKKNVAQ